MKSVLAIRHVHFEDLGAFEEEFRASGYSIRYCEAGMDALSEIDPDAPDILVVLGGPIGAYEEAIYPFLADELRILERRLAAQRPTLGICLGAQLMARALGASVYPNGRKEIGWSSLTVTEEGQRGPLASLHEKPVLHWHGDTFALPQGAQRLASTAVTENQAFAFGTTALAVQFHPEAALRSFERWLIGHACEISLVPDLTVQALRADTAKYGAQSADRGRACLKHWLAGLPQD